MDLRTVRADAALLDDLCAAGALSPDVHQAARDALRTPDAWSRWLRVVLLVVGGGLVFASVLTFFAFNWNDLPAAVRFGVLQLGIAGCALGSLVQGSTTLPGRVLRGLAFGLTGVLLAVFGQVYQTGADAYTLFAGWAALGLPFALAGRCPGVWTAWMLVTNLALGLWCDQVAIPGDVLGRGASLILVAAWNLLALAALEREAVVQAEPGARPWLRWLLFGAAVSCLWPRSWALTVSWSRVDLVGCLSLGCSVALLAGARRLFPRDLVPTAVAATSLASFVCGFAARMIFEVFPPAMGMLTTAGVIVVATWVLGSWLRSIHRRGGDHVDA